MESQFVRETLLFALIVDLEFIRTTLLKFISMRIFRVEKLYT